MDAINIYARYIQIFAPMKEYLKLVNYILHLHTFILLLAQKFRVNQDKYQSIVSKFMKKITTMSLHSNKKYAFVSTLLIIFLDNFLRAFMNEYHYMIHIFINI